MDYAAGWIWIMQLVGTGQVFKRFETVITVVESRLFIDRIYDNDRSAFAAIFRALIEWSKIHHELGDAVLEARNGPERQKVHLSGPLES